MKVGAKSGEIQAQQATIARLEAELSGSIATQNAALAKLNEVIARWQSEVNNSRTEYNRYEQLYQQGAAVSGFKLQLS